MVEKIIINPNKVRGYGNIMSPHSTSDYETYASSITSGTDTVNGVLEEVFTLSPDSSHSYALAFSQSSYVAVGGSAEVSVTLTDNGVSVGSAVITFSGGSSTVTATTNSNGVATATVTVTQDSTITASFSNLTATCTVTVQSYLFYDSGVTGTKNTDFLCTKSSGDYTLTTESTGTVFLCSGGDGFYIPNIDLHSYSSLEITWTFTYGTRYACHISLLNSNKSYSNNMRWHNTGTSTPTTSWYTPSGQTSISHTLTSGDEMKLTLSNGTWSLYCEDELIGTATPNYDVYYIGLTSADNNRPFGYKELKIAEAL